MKNIKLTIIALISLSITSCSNDDYSCNSELAKSIVKSIWKDGTSENKLAYRMLGQNIDNINSFIDEYIVIEQVRTISKNDELKRCECAAKAVFNIPQEIKESITIMKNKGGLMGYAVMESYTSEDGIDIEYNVQETEDGDIYAETYEIENLSEMIMFYRNLITEHQNSNRKGEVIVWTPVEKGYGGDYTMTFIENNKVEVVYKYMEFEDTVYADYNPETYKFTFDGDWEQFKFDGDLLRVDGVEGELVYKRK